MALDEAVTVGLAPYVGAQAELYLEANGLRGRKGLVERAIRRDFAKPSSVPESVRFAAEELAMAIGDEYMPYAQEG